MKNIHKNPRSKKNPIFIMLLLLIFISGSLFSQITISTKDPTSSNDNGTATVSVNGGTPPYTYIWSTGETTTKITGLSGSYKGTIYKVTVTDIHACSASQSALIYFNEGNELDVSISGGSASVEYCRQTGPPSITLCANATGGAGGYTYSWGNNCKEVNSGGIYTVTVTDSTKATGFASTFVVFIDIDCALDPNEIYGPNGYNEEKWVSVNDKLPYEIFFENDPEFATAPAQKVVVYFPIDDHLNMFSFRLVNFGFGEFLFEVPPNTSFYSKRLDLIDSLGVYVDVTAGLDVTQQQAFWIFESIDPATGLPPNDPHVGFLPINDSIFHKGEGFVGFYISPKSSSNTGDTVIAVADIIFDINDALATNIWTNVIDAVAPTSSVSPLPVSTDTTSFIVSFTGNDDTGGCGLENVSLYISKNNDPYTVYGEYDINDQVVITGEENDYFRFFSIAKDFVHNVETMKSSAEAFTTITYNKSISGTISYDNGLSTIMNDVSVYLIDSLGTTIDTTISDAAGYYIFGNIKPGSYSLDASSTKAWGGGNATDALGIMLHFILQDTLFGLRLDAADIDASGYVNTIDALGVSLRFTQIINSFAAGDWIFEHDNVIISEDHVINDFMGICTGDIDGSYVPPSTKVEPSVTLLNDSIIEVNPLETIVLPVRVTKDLGVGAISLIMKYPDFEIDILDVWSDAPDIENLNYNELSGELRIAWYSLNPFKIKADESLLFLKIKLKDHGAINHYTGFELDGQSELADNKAKVHKNVVLNMAQLKILEIPAEYSLSDNYPNPFNDYTEISYTLPENGKVTLSVFNMLGKHIATLVDQDQGAGKYMLNFDGSNLAPGTYLYKLDVEGETQNFSESKNMVIMQK
ncbi:MAG: T9SS type A sorting domain-containing protein [Bacteroidales bacterium]|nr:T9SS type A sorting domain-containing protein [Bacteroidales bacterium]